MKQEVLVQFPWPSLSILGLVIFFCFFTVLVWRVSRSQTKHAYESASTLPLHDGEKYE